MGTDVQTILREGRSIWNGVPVCGEPVSVPTIAIVLGKIHGDLCYQARRVLEGRDASTDDLRRELGNLITTAVRWVDDLGFDIDDCLQASYTAQRAYVARTEKSRR